MINFKAEILYRLKIVKSFYLYNCFWHEIKTKMV